MARNLLTEMQIRRAKPKPLEYLLADGGNLYFRVRPDGAKGWVFIYRLNGSRKKRGLGIYPLVGLGTARDLAADCREHIAKGIDPVEAEQAARIERKAEKQRRAARHTVRTLFDEWQRRELSARRKDKGVSARAAFEREVFKKHGDRFADEITKRDIQAIMDKVAERGARRSANVLRALLRQMFGYAMDRDVIMADPTARVKKLAGADTERTRFLKPEEIRELAEKLPGSALPPRFQSAVWIMLATCCRVGELSLSRWSDLDLEAGTWKIPAATAKNGRDHLIHLSDFARRHFASIPRIKGNEYVFPSRDERTPVDRQTISKELRDRQRATLIKGRSTKAGVLQLSGGAWTAHDLRRTGATYMGELNIAPHVIDRCLNHIEASKVTRTYQRQELIAERREAFEKLGERLNAILAAESEKVTMFPGKGRH